MEPPYCEKKMMQSYDHENNIMSFTINHVG